MNFPLFHIRRAGHLLGALLVALLAGCGAHGNLYEGFRSDLEQLAGTPLSDARLSHIGPLLERTPDAVKPLVKSNSRQGMMNDEEEHRPRTIREVFEGGAWVDIDQLTESQLPIADWEQSRRVFSVDYEGKRYYARYQFDASLQPLPVIKDVLAAYGQVADPWQLAAWFHFPSAWLVERDEQGARSIAPKDALERGEAVVEAAAKRLSGYIT